MAEATSVPKRCFDLCLTQLAAAAITAVEFAAVLFAAVVRRAISQRRAFPTDCSDAAITAVAFAAILGDGEGGGGDGGGGLSCGGGGGDGDGGGGFAAIVRRAISQRRAFATDCSDAAITAAAVFAAGDAGCMSVTFDSSSIVPASFKRAHLVAEGPSNVTGTIEVFCRGGPGAASVVSTFDATSLPTGCGPVLLVVRRSLMCRFAAARRAAVFAAIALMSPALEALAGAAEVVCLDGRPESAPRGSAASVTGVAGGCASGAANMLLAGATAELAGDAHSQRSGGQMDGVLPQLLMHQLESCGALSELSATQVVGSPPSTRAVGRRCSTDVA
mmetsp:Transcript_60564/g.145666  ORF Transcript_60564/g.145666 Transcript_60564/m.145666 type:complete len:332 (+) Transcript_60564:1803-2798(+)